MERRACRLIAAATIVVAASTPAVARIGPRSSAPQSPATQAPATQAPATTPPAAAPPIDEAFRADIVKVLDLSGASRIGAQMGELVAASALAALRKQNPDMPARVPELARQVLREEYGKAFEEAGSFKSELVALYAKHFTRDEIRGLIAFYESPVGRKFVAETPALARESSAIGQRWAQERAPAIMKTLEARLRAEGLLK